jgi:hypothetical protein
LYITPVYYIYLDSFQNWFSSRRGRSRTEDEMLLGEPVLAGKSQR